MSAALPPESQRGAGTLFGLRSISMDKSFLLRTEATR